MDTNTNKLVHKVVDASKLVLYLCVPIRLLITRFLNTWTWNHGCCKSQSTSYKWMGQSSNVKQLLNNNFSNICYQQLSANSLVHLHIIIIRFYCNRDSHVSQIIDRDYITPDYITDGCNHTSASEQHTSSQHASCCPQRLY